MQNQGVNYPEYSEEETRKQAEEWAKGLPDADKVIETYRINQVAHPFINSYTLTGKEQEPK